MKTKISKTTWASIVKDHTIDKKSVKKICEERSMNYRTVYYGLKRYNIIPDSTLTDLRRFKVNDEYFKNIDCENKAYILGLLITDGTINIKHKRLVLKLKESDKYLLDFINQEIAGQYKIGEDYSTINGKTFKSYRIEIQSESLVNQLINLGVIPNKTSKEILPILNDNLMSHLIRGIFDGDGSVSINKRFVGKAKMLNANICSASKEFLEVINKYCVGNIYTESRTGLNMHRLLFTSKQMKIDFYNYIYKDASIYLKRKKLIFDNYVNTVLN